MIFLALLIPVIVTIGFYMWNKRKIVWWETLIPLVATFVVIMLTKVIFDSARVSFDEWWGGSVVSVFEEEPYNVWDHETCTQRYACGTDSEGHTKYCSYSYDCSHQDNYGPSWYMKTNLGDNISISEKEYERIKAKFGTQPINIKEIRNHSASSSARNSSNTKFDGQRVGTYSYVYRVDWNKTDLTRVAFTSKHTYKNKVRAADLSEFNMIKVSDEKADSLKLFKYPNGPKYSHGLQFTTILGDNISNIVQDRFKQLNGKFGMSDSLRLWVLVFPYGTPYEIAEYQENYWVKGNKNELVICVCPYSDQTINWVHTFSWGKPTGIVEDCKTELVNIEKLDEAGWFKYADWLNKNLHRFDKRNFTEEFSYLKLAPSKASIITILYFRF